jgi:hypothetical protein
LYYSLAEAQQMKCWNGMAALWVINFTTQKTSYNPIGKEIYIAKIVDTHLLFDLK